MEFDLNGKTYPRFCLILKEFVAKKLCAFEVCMKLEGNISFLNLYFVKILRFHFYSNRKKISISRYINQFD